MGRYEDELEKTTIREQMHMMKMAAILESQHVAQKHYCIHPSDKMSGTYCRTELDSENIPTDYPGIFFVCGENRKPPACKTDVAKNNKKKTKRAMEKERIINGCGL